MSNRRVEPSEVDLSSLPLFAPEPAAEDRPVRNAHFLAAAGSTPAAPASSAQPERPWTAGAHRAGTGDLPGRRQKTAYTPRAQYLAYIAEQARRHGMGWSRLNWVHVALIQAKVAEEITKEVRPAEETASLLAPKSEESVLDPEARAELEQRGRALIAQEVAKQAKAQFNAGTASWDDDYLELLREGVFISQFRLGRLQLLLDRPGVEDIIINGHSNIWLRLEGGNLVRIEEPIASSDRELEGMLQRYGQLNPTGARTISAAAPMMNMTLPGGERLAAVMPPIDKTVSITIRKHNLIDIGFDELIRRGTATQAHGALLDAAVNAGLNVVLVGAPGTGKTTSARALANFLPPEEPIATIEDVRELHLDLMDDRHLLVLPWQSVEGAGEWKPDGTRVGDIGLWRLMHQSLRHSVRRIFVGEVRGPAEVISMFEATRAGTGSISTLHAAGAQGTIDRFADLYMRAMPGIDPATAYLEVGDCIDLVVHIEIRKDPQTGTYRRYISEISEVFVGEKAGTRWPVHVELFRSAPGTYQAAPTGTVLRQETALRLAEHGFDQDEWLTRPDGGVL